MTQKQQCCYEEEYGNQCRRDACYGIYHVEHGGIHDTYSCAEHVGYMLTVPWDDKKHPEVWTVAALDGHASGAKG